MAKKAKTNKAAKKRFKITRKGKIFHKIQGSNTHLKHKKSRAQKLRRKGNKLLANTKLAKKIKTLIS